MHYSGHFTKLLVNMHSCLRLYDHFNTSPSFIERKITKCVTLKLLALLSQASQILGLQTWAIMPRNAPPPILNIVSNKIN